jgi:hypothetical protein
VRRHALIVKSIETLLNHHLDKDTLSAVTFKDVLVSGAVTTGLARIVSDELAVRAQNVSPSRGVRLGSALRFLNLGLVSGAIAATPFINFALFNDYRPIRFAASLGCRRHCEEAHSSIHRGRSLI